MSVVNSFSSSIHMYHKVAATTLGQLTQMIRARMLTEIGRDIFYASDGFEWSYDARDKKMGRPEDKGAVLAMWRGLV